MTSFSIRNFGCRVNQAEAFDWAALLQERGLTLTEFPEAGGLIIVNTCTLTARADRDVRKFIRRAAREHPGSRIVVTGCLAERSPAGLAGMPGVWKVLSNREKAGLPGEILKDTAPLAAAAGPRPPRFRARAFLKVQDGCDMSCAFCVIPSVRGGSASVPLASTVDRVREWASRGYAEIVLTGINLCSYGRDLDPRSSLLDLLRALDAAPGAVDLRLSSLDPRLMPAPLVDHLTAAKRIRPHFHLSLQHASPPVLRAMGRASAPAEYQALLDGLSRGRPEAALGADVIVGFPGETESDFAALADFVERSPLTYLHVFAYSPRPGTAAGAPGYARGSGSAVLGRALNTRTSAAAGGRSAEGRPGVPSAVDPAVKARRAARLRAAARRKDFEFRRRFVGRDLDGLVIQPAEDGAQILTANGIQVTIPARLSPKGEPVRVRITDVTEGSTAGKLIE